MSREVTHRNPHRQRPIVNASGGALSPAFLKKEFPQQYSAEARKPRHPAEQLQFFLNALGKENWELVDAPQVGPLLMFVFKRPNTDPATTSEPTPQPPKDT